jgi:hypothetical protein
MSDSLQPRSDVSPVPVAYAEKTMASLLQLHSELMEEKERRVELYRRLMEKDEALAELRYQVKILEDRVRRAEGTPPPAAQLTPPPDLPTAPPVASPAPAATARAEAPPPPSPAPLVRQAASPSAPPRTAAGRPAREDWRQW